MVSAADMASVSVEYHCVRYVFCLCFLKVFRAFEAAALGGKDDAAEFLLEFYLASCGGDWKTVNISRGTDE